MHRFAFAALVIAALLLAFGCTGLLGVDTDYLENPCLAPGAASLPPLSCGVGACSELAPACVNDLPAECPAASPKVEVCNGLDDDCNGAVDDTCPCMGTATQLCYPGSVATRSIGACKDGTQTCNGTLWGPCEGAVVPVGEACDNGLDDNCDGQIDEGCPCDPGVSQPCYDGPIATRGVGACKDGNQACDSAGHLGACTGSVKPATEVCDGVDDDCNGTVDDGCPCAPDETQDCYTGPDGTLDVGECAGGKQACDKGAWAPCAGDVVPVDEKCNKKDDDCDGQTDEDNPEGGDACDTGKLGACAAGLITCTNGVLVCKQTLMPSPEKCNGVDDDCDGQTDENDPEGGLACMTGFPGTCALGTLTCLDGSVKCVPNVKSAEVCDGVDNDCDGQIDNGLGVGNPCVAGVGACQKNGTFICGPNGQPVCDAMPGSGSGEVCDGLDNNCDGSIDEGNPGGGLACMTGFPGACALGTTACQNGVIACTPVNVTDEVCDGIDNNCDGIADNVLGVGLPCTAGQGACQTTGVYVCGVGGMLACNAVPGNPSGEVCDGLDNDCNGTVDDNNPGGGQGCNTGLQGICAAGTTACQNGTIKCQANAAQMEKCDGIDNDCDGTIDDGFGVGTPCLGGMGACQKPGVLVCAANGLSAVCNAVPGPPSGEVCDGLDNDCNGTVDDNNPGGGLSCNTGFPGACAAGTTTCANGAIQCTPNNAGVPETCDGLDNDCDGLIDDGLGLGLPCTAGQGACQNTGVKVCGPGGAVVCNAVPGMPSGEVCDGIDNNCNGTVDENNPGGGAGCNTGLPGTCAMGTTACQNGTLQCVASAVGVEKCDGLDNDCDGQIDDGFGVGTPCTAGVGACQKPGVLACAANGLSAVCNAVPGMPSGEVCDGIDNNCNGTVDDGDPGGGAGCNTGLQGACGAGTTKCVNGAVLCIASAAQMETCDGVDNDCDGTVDDGFGVETPCLKGVGACQKPGVIACDAGGLATCNAVPGLPSGEVCDGIDNNCNGQIDENNPGGGVACSTGFPGACGSGTTTCVNGAIHCTPNNAGVPEVCDGIDNDCDGQIDNGLGLGLACTVGQGSCQKAGVKVCGLGGAVVCNAVPGQPSAEVCDGADNNCNGVVDDGNPGGGAACATGLQGTCAQGITVCQNGSLFCQASAGGIEACDGLDNDCDGLIDDGFGLGTPCTNGVGACQKPGVLVCAANGLSAVCNAVPGQPSGEVCDGIDNNCVGGVDENNPGGGVACSTGFPGGCAVGTTKCQDGVVQCMANAGIPEVCDGVDNDCDGQIDNGLGLGLPCSLGMGSCKANGVFVCGPGSTVLCNAVPGQPTGEVCDGLDNNCNGLIDDNAPSGAPCMTGLPGACASGTTQCLSGATVCVANAGVPETCDGVDNDCDGQIDNGLSLGLPCTAGAGACQKTGVNVCGAGGIVVCNAVPGQPSGEVCDGIDNNCVGGVDEGNPGGNQACSTGLPGLCATGTTLCQNGAIQCQANAGGVETCDGVDNDCDGLIDDGFGVGTPCTSAGFGACKKAGVFVCAANGQAVCNAVPGQPTGEVCDGVDNNCDGTIDENDPGGGNGCNTGLPGACAAGTTTCQNGAIKCQAAAALLFELCDGIDNNCNGQIDEGLGLGLPCTAGQGACQKSGVNVCNAANSVVCNAVPGMPSGEVCDGIDNNCDGQTDEGNPGGGVGCNTGFAGLCAFGTTKCLNGAIQCQPNLAGVPETCDGVDNNCDGAVDNGIGLGNPCFSAGQGVCKVAGTNVCGAGGTVVCNAVEGSPTPEVCDGVDNNCNGQIDEGSTEVCDGVDNDCDGQIDEGSTCTVCLDFLDMTIYAVAIAGDHEFAGHGPLVTISAVITRTAANVSIQITVKMDETDNGDTHALTIASQTQPLANSALLSPSSFSVQYTDHDHALDNAIAESGLSNPSPGVLTAINCVGDTATGDDDCGSGACSQCTVQLGCINVTMTPP